MPRALAALFGATLAMLSSLAAAAQDGDAAEPRRGTFLLVDHSGRTVTDADFGPKYLLVYFGYTYCPDVCPTTLQTITDALDLLGEEADKVQPLMITVDPERDTPEHLRDYLVHFHPRLVGLTGPRSHIDAVARRYRIKYAPVESPVGGSTLFDHTSATILVGPDRSFLDRLGHNVTPQFMAERIRGHLQGSVQ